MWFYGSPGDAKCGAMFLGGIGLLPSPTMSPRPATPAVAGHLYLCGPSMGREE